jgi:hypothetical protein
MSLSILQPLIIFDDARAFARHKHPRHALLRNATAADADLNTTMGTAMKKLWIQTRIGLPGLLVSALLLAACGGSNGGAGGTTMLTVGGNVTGLVTGTSVELENGGQTATITANGSYSVSGTFISGTSYDVTVAQQPAGANCAVTNGSGMVGTSNIANILVTCTPNGYMISGALTGMLGGRSLMLQDNGGNSTTVSASGSTWTPPLCQAFFS